LRIGAHVDWENELECFDSLATELAFFYSPTPFLSPVRSPPPTSSQPHNDVNDEQSKRKETDLIKNVLYPAFKQYLIPSDTLFTGKRRKRGEAGDATEADEEIGEKDAVVLITRLESLYKVFERC
jgi:DNA mismatch repair protein MLH1